MPDTEQPIHVNSTHFEQGKPKRFAVDYNRLFPDERELLRERPHEVFTLSRRGIYSGIEHKLAGSSYDFRESYPLTPSALLADPESIETINQKRKEAGEMIVYNNAAITPDFTAAGYINVRISLEEIDSATGEPKILPRVTALKRKDIDELVRDTAVLDQYKFSPYGVAESWVREMRVPINRGQLSDEKKKEEIIRLKAFVQHYSHLSPEEKNSLLQLIGDLPGAPESSEPTRLAGS